MTGGWDTPSPVVHMKPRWGESIARELRSEREILISTERALEQLGPRESSIAVGCLRHSDHLSWGTAYSEPKGSADFARCQSPFCFDLDELDHGTASSFVNKLDLEQRLAP